MRIHKGRQKSIFSLLVVNWFQIVFLREDSQAQVAVYKHISCCELISNCIFTWGFTSDAEEKITLEALWIDFKLYFYVRIHKLITILILYKHVVNWFQIVFLREDSQVHPKRLQCSIGCELISNCIFTWGFTSDAEEKITLEALWIDFKLYFYVRIHKRQQ